MADATSTALAAALAGAGSDRIFGLPGGGPNLDVIGAAERCGIDFVLTHGETAAAIMASTYGLLTGTPSAVVVTRGPGVASVVNGAAQATLDRFPLVVVGDTVSSADRHRVAHQRIDQLSLMATVTKAAASVGPGAGSAALADLIQLALAPPRGAVHLDIDPSSAGVEPVPSGDEPRAPVADRVDDFAEAARLLDRSSQPVVIVGLGAIEAADRLRPVLAGLGAPVLSTYQAVGVVPTDADISAGLFTNGALERPVLDDSDLVVTIGLDPVEPIPAPWERSAPVLSLAPIPTVDRYLPIAVELVGDVGELAAAVLSGRTTSWGPTAGADHRLRALQRVIGQKPDRVLGPLDVVDVARRAVPEQATVTVDAGAHFLAVMPMWEVRNPHQLLISNGLATMGFAVPAAIGAALARPDRPVMCLTGDGGLAMTSAELETIARLALPVTVIVFNDAALSLIEIKQGPDHGGPSTVRYRAVDLAAQARAMGLGASTVTTTDELEVELGRDWSAPRLIDARIDPTDYRRLITVTRG